MKILAIESSCDETAAAIVEMNGEYPKVLSNIVASQIDIHAKYGGVVPEVAARAHMESINPVIKEALAEAGLKLSEVDRLAVTEGPGLIGSLVVGVETAKAISLATEIPIFPINHLEGHIYASFTRFNAKDQITNTKWEAPVFPLVALMVSGGNTLLVHMNDHFQYEVIGQTWDDAAGEAFDKGAKLMGLGYPGGPILSKLATEGSADKYDFPVIDLTEAPTRNKDGFLDYAEPSMDFSFSGLKTSLLNKVKTMPKLTEQNKKDLAAGFEQAIVKTLIQNSLRAVEKYKPKTFILAGGVAANKKLRTDLGCALNDFTPDTKYLIPDISLCGDNAAMIGAVAAFRQDSEASGDFSANPGLKL
jgi:N6-L-threonylcarbamoyladenine synthase